jgi:hypothetical protein
MLKRFLIAIFTLFTFVTISNAQSHAYVYISPDYGGCTGRLIILPVCIDLPQPITYTSNIGGNVQSGPGPWAAYNLCGSITQFMITAVDGLGNSHTLLSGSVNLNTSNPSITYGVQTISSPLTIVHTFQPSGPMCNGSTNFSITGGYTPYVYNMINQSNSTAVPLVPTPPSNYVVNNLCPAPYSFTISDNFFSPNCPIGTNSAAFPFNINFFSCVVATTDLTCAGVCNGSAQLIPVGDMNIVGMFMNGPSSAGSGPLYNQCPGGVMGTLIHTSGQQATCFGQINEPLPLNVSINTSDCSGFGMNDGTATAIVSGGTPGYSYLWSTGGTQNIEDSLLAGNICVVVSDFNGCDTTVCANVNQPAQLIIQITNVVHQTSSTPNGSVTFTINGGVPPYLPKLIRYAQNDTVNSSFTNLAAGNYAIYIIDANNISATQPFTINNNIPGGMIENAQLNVKLYPNPARQQLWIEAEQISLVEIYHISGQLVLQQQLNNETKVELNIAELPSGSYWVRIVNQQNQKVLPFIKQ